MHEDLDITNHGRKPVRFNLEIAIRSDFADVFEVKAATASCAAAVSPPTWSEAHQRLRTDLSQPATSCARCSVGTRDARTSTPSTPMGGSASRCSIDPGATWHCCLLYDLIDGNRHFHGTA